MSIKVLQISIIYLKIIKEIEKKKKKQRKKEEERTEVQGMVGPPFKVLKG
jgi:hypothetical protein